MPARYRRSCQSLLILALLCVTAAWAADKRSRPVKRARPPRTWNPEVDEVFSRDATTLLSGPRPTLRKDGATPGGVEPGNGISSPAADDFAWSRLISPEVLTDEIKVSKAEADQHLSNPSAFKSGGNNQIRRLYSVNAVMFAIIARHDKDVRWKEIAAGARDLFARAGRNAKAADDATYKESKARAEDLGALLRGESIEVPPPDPDLRWDQVTDLNPLMRRLELAFEKRLRGWTAKQTEFARHQPETVHEAEIIAALAEVIHEEEFENYDDEEYVGFCEQLQKGALSVADAARLGNFEAAQSAAGQIYKACSQCHEVYR